MAEIARLPGPDLSLWEWQFEGLCNSSNPEEFFHPEGERGPNRRRREDAAKRICQSCPVLQRCRDHALAAREPYGIWGGMSESDRLRQYALDDPGHSRRAS